MLSDDQIRADASITLLCGISASSHVVLELCSSAFFLFEAEDVQKSQRERQGMTDFHVNPNKAPIVHSAPCVWSFCSLETHFCQSLFVPDKDIVSE